MVDMESVIAQVVDTIKKREAEESTESLIPYVKKILRMAYPQALGTKDLHEILLQVGFDIGIWSIKGAIREIVVRGDAEFAGKEPRLDITGRAYKIPTYRSTGGFGE